MKIKKFSEKPSDLKSRIGAKPIVCYPNNSIEEKDLRLVDYKVRILNTGTEAVTRVSIESTDSKGVNWFTIGVSPNIIDASFKALVDSLDYKLFKDKAPGSS